jgi:hypothetical protein
MTSLREGINSGMDKYNQAKLVSLAFVFFMHRFL